MPLVLNPEFERKKRTYLSQQGLNPDAYDIDDQGFIVPAVAPAPEPQVFTPPVSERSFLGSLAKTAAGYLPEAAGGVMGGAAGGAALGALGGPFAPVTVPLGTVVGALAGAYGAGKVKEAVMPEAWQQELAAIQEERPLTSLAGQVLAQGPFFKPSIRNIQNVGNFLTRGGVLNRLSSPATLRTPEFANALNVGLGATIGGGIPMVEALREKRDIPWDQVALGAGSGALFSEPTRLGTKLSFGQFKPTGDYRASLRSKMKQGEPLLTEPLAGGEYPYQTSEELTDAVRARANRELAPGLESEYERAWQGYGEALPANPPVPSPIRQKLEEVGYLSVVGEGLDSAALRRVQEEEARQFFLQHAVKTPKARDKDLANLQKEISQSHIREALGEPGQPEVRRATERQLMLHKVYRELAPRLAQAEQAPWEYGMGEQTLPTGEVTPTTVRPTPKALAAEQVRLTAEINAEREAQIRANVLAGQEKLRQRNLAAAEQKRIRFETEAENARVRVAASTLQEDLQAGQIPPGTSVAELLARKRTLLRESQQLPEAGRTEVERIQDELEGTGARYQEGEAPRSLIDQLEEARAESGAASEFELKSNLGPVSRKWWEFWRNYGEQTAGTDTRLVNQIPAPIGTIRYGAATAGAGENAKTLVELAKLQNWNTAPHEFAHGLFTHIANNGTESERKLLARMLKTAGWDGQGSILAAEEELARVSGDEFVRMWMAPDKPRLRDDVATMLRRWRGKMTKADASRMISNELRVGRVWDDATKARIARTPVAGESEAKESELSEPRFQEVELPSGERVVGTAVRIRGKPVTGANPNSPHYNIFHDEISRRGLDPRSPEGIDLSTKWFGDGENSGFITNTGRFVTREEAANIAGLQERARLLSDDITSAGKIDPRLTQDAKIVAKDSSYALQKRSSTGVDETQPSETIQGMGGEVRYSEGLAKENQVGEREVSEDIIGPRGPTTIDSTGVRVTNAGKISGIDAGIAGLIEDINTAGYESTQSMSGLKEDYPTGARYHPDGYVAFFKRNLTPEQRNKIKLAAQKANIYSDDTSELFLQPSVDVRVGMLKNGKHPFEYHKEANALATKQMMDSGRLTESDMDRARSEFVRPGKARDYPKGEKFLEWLHIRDKINADIREKAGGIIDDAEIKSRWTAFRNALLNEPRYQQGKLSSAYTKLLAGATDQLRADPRPTAQHAADVIDEVHRYTRQFRGKYVNPQIAALKDINAAEQKQLAELMHQEQQQRKDLSASLPSKLVDARNTLRWGWNEMAKEQKAKGQLLSTGQERGVDPFYFPQTRSALVQQILADPSRYSTEFAQLKKDFENHFRAKGWKPADIDARFRDETGRLSKPTPAEGELEFNPVTEPAGEGLPKSWITTDLKSLVANYGENFGMGRAKFDLMDTDPRYRASIGETTYRKPKQAKPEPIHPTTLASEGSPENSIAKHPAMQYFLDSVGGKLLASSNKGMRGITSLLFSSILGGPVRAVTDLVTNIPKAVGIAGPRHLNAVLRALTRGRQGVRDAVQQGFIREGGNMISQEVLGISERANAKLAKAADWINKITGSESLERWSRGLAQSIGDEVGESVRLSAIGGNPDDVRFLERAAGPNWRTISREELGTRVGQILQGRYDITNLPRWIQDSSLAPFFAMMKWSTEQTNNFKKFALDPAFKDKNWTPLIMQIAAGIGGGLGIEEIRAQLSNRPKQTATLAELKHAQGKPGYMREMAYKLIAAAQVTGTAGLLGEFARQGYEATNDMLPQGVRFPLVEVGTDIGKRTISAAKAMMDGEQVIDVLPQLIKDIGSSHVQALRFLVNQSARVLPQDASFLGISPGQEYQDVKQRRDMRLYRRIEGLPTTIGPVDFPPYKSLTERRFDRELDLGKASEMAGQLTQRAFASDNPEVISSKLRSAASIPNRMMPSMKSNPQEFLKYYQFIAQTQGEDAANQLLSQYMQRDAAAVVKKSLIPQLNY